MNIKNNGQLDNKNISELESNLNDIFERLWNQFIDLKKEITDLYIAYEQNPSDEYARIIRGMILTANGLVGSTRRLGKVLYNGPIYDNFSDNCNAKMDELLEISKKLNGRKY